MPLKKIKKVVDNSSNFEKNNAPLQSESKTVNGYATVWKTS